MTLRLWMSALVIVGVTNVNGAAVRAHGTVHTRLARVNGRLATSPRDPSLWVMRASLHREHRDLDSAQRDLDHALALDDRHHDALLARAGLALARQRYDETIDRCRDLIDHSPDDAGATLILARALTASGQLESAFDSYERVIELLPRPAPDLFLEQARVARRAFPNHPYLAAWSLEAGVERLGPIVSLVLPLIELEVASELYAVAEARVDTLLRQSTRAGRWLVLRAEIRLAAGDHELARNDAALAIESLGSSKRRPGSKLTTQLLERANRVVIESHLNLEKQP